MGLAGFLAGLLAAALLLAGYLASVEIARRVYYTLSPASQPEEGPTWSAYGHWQDLVGVAVVSLLLGPLRRIGRGRSGFWLRPGRRQWSSSPRPWPLRSWISNRGWGV